MAENEFKLTYYIGVMLAYGGNLTIQHDKLVFIPGAVERAMGASDTVIPFEQVKMVEVTGTITESLIVRTQEKAHRFVGGDPYKIRDRINASLQNVHVYRPAVSSAPSAAAKQDPSGAVAAQTQVAEEKRAAVSSLEKAGFHGQCPSCFKNLKSDFSFCPYCKTAVRKICPQCRRMTEPDWKFCPSCSSNL